eukprot:Blabericola_migrator_1__1410@NODE_1368_length_4703_cov_24_996333_g183_i2_p3_GENE_NODE_1368_length_4703_cov_24_996333_g183_i2NODE_1368_length_4703_cov_24_996333_g183_i2_p3_ORF_typecomplete_len273_score44_81RNA_pol_A_CTD/PF03118_15/3_5e03RNA_pol_A_CTD/PF03118_15/0_083_NODE_1368_length_4703_cov_24_996333_g183_i22201038
MFVSAGDLVPASSVLTTSSGALEDVELEGNEGDIPDPESTEMWKYLVTPEIAHQLDQPLSEVDALVRKTIWNLHVTTLAEVASIPEHVLLRQGLPAAFVQIMRRGVPAGSACSEVERHLWAHGFDVGFNSEEIRHIVDRLVKKNWLETWDAVRALPLSYWSKLGLRDSQIVRKTQVLMERYESPDKLNGAGPLSITRLLQSMCLRLGKDYKTMKSLSDRLRDEHRIETVADLMNKSEDQLITMGVPVRLVLELRHLRSSDPVSHSSKQACVC